MRRRHGHLEPVELCSQEAFAAHSRRFARCKSGPWPDAEALAGRIVRKHCAGMPGPPPTGTGIIAALARPPDPDCNHSAAVDWMLSTIHPHECSILLAGCGVRVEDLARHARAHCYRRPSLVRYLNQFADMFDEGSVPC